MNELTPEKSMNRQSFAVPIAIVIAAALVAGAIYFSDRGASTGNPNNPAAEEKIDLRPVDSSDHIKGNPNAPILLVEYSDYDCPFCDLFHDTMNRIMDEYGADGKVSWVFRHFPLEQLHPNAPKIAEAAECVAEQAGNDGFWKFSDTVFGSKTVDPDKNIVEFTDMTKLGDYAVAAGADRAQFENCLASGKYGEKVAESVNDAVKAGGEGTPYTIVIVGDQTGVINGAQPYDTVRGIVSNLVAQLDGEEVSE